MDSPEWEMSEEETRQWVKAQEEFPLVERWLRRTLALRERQETNALLGCKTVEALFEAKGRLFILNSLNNLFDRLEEGGKS
jgi:hypothetical protein